MSPEMPQASFSALVQVVAQQALVAMGEPLPGVPPGQLPPADPRVARFFVDLLGILQERTKGHLDASEAKELEDALYVLRMRIVNLSRGDAPTTGASRGA